MRRLALLTFASLGACTRGGTRASSEAPSARAPELAEVTGCDDATLRAFDPGLPGMERVSLDHRRLPDPPLLREYARACALAEDDDDCQARARRDVLAADPRATIGDVAMAGEPDGWEAQLEVDGQRRELRVPQEVDVIAEARRLRSLGHRVVPLEGRRVVRQDSRRALVHYAVPVSRAEPRARWEVTLRWPVPANVIETVERLQREAARANLVLVRYAIQLDEADPALVGAIACP